METQQDPCKLPRNGRRVILFPLPFQGHINPMLQLGSILYSEGFSITIIHTTLNSPNSCNYPHFEFCSFSDDGFSETYQPSKVADDIPALLLSLNAKCIVPFRDCLANKLMSNAQESKDSFACLITDAAWFIALSVANDFKLPTIVLLTDSIAASLSYAAFPILREKGYLPIQDFQLEAPVIEFPPLRVKDIPLLKTQDSNNADKFLSIRDNQIMASSGIIWNSFEDLEQVELTTVHQQYYLSIPVFPIGPFHKYFPAYSSSLLSQDQSSISWLDRQAPRSVIYVSFGSIAAINEIEFLEIAWGLANSRVPFLWVVRPGLGRGAEWLEPLPKGFLEMVDGRGYIVKWAPQQQVLAHPAVGCFWTHSGWNSTMESICEGIPMICQPYFADQMVNSRYVSHVWRVGLHLEGKLEREGIERAIRRVMVEADGQGMRERAMYLKEKVDICLQRGGSSYQSLGRLTDHILSL
ncbi:UDP-glycosyltransferase 76B1-like isoform X2 [Citrus sinensis]|uniref:UDP-glycosyltransferase 76B1-like isoform X2 n=1 Tax=Citrus sinensis TaxID=2711 RepID=UPI00227812A7|nr:UDP-glycosyltransferase 76B1-like isoform X2 [Citrus sinensis]